MIHLPARLYTLEDVQRELLELIAAETILIGHSLENDLNRLKMMHANCVDTVVGPGLANDATCHIT